MGENNNAGADDIEIVETEEGAEDLDESQNDGGADDADKGSDNSDNDKSEDKTKDDEANGKSDDKTEDKSKKPTPNADEEPKTRKRNIDFILERKNEKIKKLQERANGAYADKEDEDEDNLDPNDAQIIQKHVAKALSPFLAKQMQDEDNQEIGDFVKQNPDFAPYQTKVQKFAQHPSRRDMPIKAIFYEVAGDDLLKIGAERAKRAGIESKKSRAGGGGSSGGGSEKGVWDLSPEEFEAQKESVRIKSRE
jgi:hypothetical protein